MVFYQVREIPVHGLSVGVGYKKYTDCWIGEIMNTSVALHKDSFPSFAMSEEELMNVLRNSLYPGAQDESIKMVIGYCKASGLDPMQKPVHIVPMWDGKQGAMRDVIMPGVGSYRTQAARSGQYAGVSDPEFGPDTTQNIGGKEITFPAWCRVVVKRLMPNGMIAEFSAVERWTENYAAKGGQDKSIAPNAMWSRRPYGQLSKCAEAQALRKAFPEVGSQPTADEMEGKEIDITPDSTPQRIENKQKTLPLLDDNAFEKKAAVWKKSMIEKNETAENLLVFLQAKYSFTEDQIETIKSWDEINENA